jgi:alpha-mannosidase
VVAIPNAHIDPVWIWDWREGMREVIATFTAAADRLDQHPDLYFAASSACYYAWVEEMDPVLFGRIRAHVAAGRWELVGGEWVEPDCNLPAGESVCRQLLYSQRYFQRAFGTTATIGYNIDSFGHAASLPQLFRKAGLRAYIMMRPGPHEKELPASLFRWEGVDGTSLPTYRIKEAYHTGLHGDEPADGAERALVETRAAALLADAISEHAPAMFFVGVGDHGGGPTQVAIDAVQRVHAETAGDVAFGSTTSYFDQVSRELAGGGALPAVRGDLHMHAVGCYTAVAWMKRENAACEAALAAAENLAAVAEMATGVRLDVQDTLRSAWTRVLFNQFHDSLGGTCTEEVCEDLRQFYGYARTQADTVVTRATQLLAMRADTAVDGTEAAERNQSLNPFVAHFPVPLVVFNPLSRPVRVPIELPHPATSVAVGHDEPVPVQPIASREGTRYAHHSLVVADLPALGHRVYWLRKEDTEAGQAAGLPAFGESGRLENDDLVVEIDRSAGAVTGITSKAGGRQWLAPEGLRPVVLADPSDTWSHFVVRYEEPEQSPQLTGAEFVEAGPVRTVARLQYAWEKSTIWMDLILYAGLPGLEVKLRVDWRQRHQLLKLIVPLAVDQPVIDAGVPYGTVERAADGREEVLNHWIGVREPSGPCVLCSSDVGYAYDAAGGRIRFTVLRSPRYADHGRPWTTDDPISQPATDQGWHEVSYRFRCYREPVPAGAGAQQADVHAASFPYVTETWHPGELGRETSAVQVSPGHVSVPVLKRAEAGGGWVLRLCEQAGQPAAATITLPLAGRSWAGPLRPYDVVTLFVPDQAGQPIREIALTELDAGDPQAGGN